MSFQQSTVGAIIYEFNFVSIIMKNILIINQYASTLETGMGGRQYYFARELVKKGHNVTLIAASFHHLLRSPVLKKSVYNKDNSEGIKFITLKTLNYKKANSIKRMFNWFLFAFWLYRFKDKFCEKPPEVVLISSPSLISFISAKYLASTYKAKLIFDVRDIWPLTLITIGGHSPKNLLIRLLQKIEDYAYKSSDFVISNWPYTNKHIKERGIDNSNFKWIPNGFTLDEFNASKDLDSHIVKKIPKDKFLVGYTGTIGKANALDTLINVAEQVYWENTDINFIIVGKGSGKSELEDMVKDKNINNVHFFDAIPKKQVPSMLSYFDICYVGFNKSYLYKYGNSLNKLPEYLASKRPIIYSIDSPFRPVDEASCGFTVPAENVAEIKSAIYKIYNMSPEEREQLGANAYGYALSNHEYKVLADQLESIIYKLDKK